MIRHFRVFGFKTFFTALAVHVDAFLIITLKDYMRLPITLEYIFLILLAPELFF